MSSGSSGAYAFTSALCFGTLSYMVYQFLNKKRSNQKCIQSAPSKYAIKCEDIAKFPGYFLIRNETIDYEVYVVYSAEDAQNILEKFKFNEEQFIGMDLEWTMDVLRLFFIQCSFLLFLCFFSF